MLINLQCLCVIGLILNGIAVAERKKSSKSILFLAVNTTFNPYHVTHYKMAIQRNNRIADVFMGVARNYTRDFWFLITVSQVNQRKVESVPMFQWDINACQLLAQAGKQVRGFLTPWLNKFWSTGNLPQKCPILQGNYTWLGLNMKMLHIPSIIPTSKYLVNVFTYGIKGDQKEMICNMNLLFEMK